MKPRRRVVVIVLAVIVLVAGGLAALPELVRRVAISRLEAMTHRQVHIDRVGLNVFTGRLAVHGFRVADRTPGQELTDFERLDVRFSPLSLLRGHLWIREAVLRRPTVRIVRSPEGLNVSDLLERPESEGGALDITVDRFALVGGTVAFEDRALSEPRTWLSEQIQVEARNVSTRDDKGVAEARSVTAGAPVTLTLEQFRLYPIHLRAAVAVSGLDLSLARLYFPPQAPAVVDQGRATTSLRLTLDAREGVRAEGGGQLENVALVRPATGERLLIVPSMTTRFTDLAFRDERLAVGRFEMTGSASVLNPTARGGPRFEASAVRATIADLTWPVESHAQIDVQTSTPGGGTATLTGAVRPPPDASQLRLRLAKVDLAPWAQFVPVPARISGQAESDLRIDEPLAAGVSTRVRGSIAVNNVSVRDGRREAVAARRIDATGLEVEWPAKISARRILITGPRGVVERDKSGELSLRRLWTAPGALAPAAPSEARASTPSAAPPRLALSVREVAVRDGALSWRDATVAPPAALDFAGIDASVTGITWPLAGPVGGRIAARPPGGGRIEAEGRVGLHPMAGDIRIRSREADLSPYEPYVPAPVRVAGWADADLAVHLPPTGDGRMTVRGTAALSRLDVRDEQRSILRLERGVASDIDMVWPERVTVREVSLRRPWALLERDERGALTLRRLLLPRGSPGDGAASNGAAPSPPAASASATDAPAAAEANGGAGKLSMALRRLVVEEGGARVVDRSLTPAFAVDMSRLDVKAEGLATAPAATPARITVTGRIGVDSLLDLEGTVGPLGGPLRVDMNGQIRGFWVPRTDPYLLRFVGWEAREGFLTTSVRCRIDRGALDAKTEITLSRLVVAKARADEAQKRIGLPLGLIVSLMKDSRGDIKLSLPVGGRLDDPRFDYSEAIWSTVKNAAIKTIAAPVSWIGRVKLTPDSRIERIEVDPVRFVPGTATFAPEGLAQVSRLIAFLREAPESRMRLTPAVSQEDVAALKRRILDPEIAKVARGADDSPEAAARRLFQQRFPERTLPESNEAVMGALMEATALPADAASELAAQRVDAIRATAKKAGIDRQRLPDVAPAKKPPAVGSQVALDVAAPGNPGRPRGGVTDFLRRLGPNADAQPDRDRGDG